MANLAQQESFKYIIAEYRDIQKQPSFMMESNNNIVKLNINLPKNDISSILKSEKYFVDGGSEFIQLGIFNDWLRLEGLHLEYDKVNSTVYVTDD